jgi:hypothetical protein
VSRVLASMAWWPRFNSGQEAPRDFSALGRADAGPRLGASVVRGDTQYAQDDLGDCHVNNERLPAARTWTLGPRLPGDPYSDLHAFEVEKSLCIVGSFGVVETMYAGYIWDPTTETWDEFPVPPIRVKHLSQKDGYVAASGYYSYDTGPGILPSAPGKRLFVLSPGSRDWAECDRELRRMLLSYAFLSSFGDVAHRTPAVLHPSPRIVYGTKASARLRYVAQRWQA